MSTTRSTKKNESRRDSTSDDSVTVGDIEGIVAKAVKADVQVVREKFQNCLDVISNSAFFIFAVLVVQFSHSRPYKMF